jgi:hypothetical protein
MEFLSDVGGGEDRHRPSFFELAAQGEQLTTLASPEQLRDLLAPVVRYVLSVSALSEMGALEHGLMLLGDRSSPSVTPGIYFG